MGIARQPSYLTLFSLYNIMKTVDYRLVDVLNLRKLKFRSSLFKGLRKTFICLRAVY